VTETLAIERDRLRPIPAGPERDAFWSLLMLADDSETQVRAYYQRGELYALEDDAGQPLGIVHVLPYGTEPHEFEIKAVAVSADRHGQGLGTRMLSSVLGELRRQGARRVVLGTGNSGIGQIAFYQKAGFRMWRIERDFFTPERGYPADLEENGIPLRDMIWFDQDLR
jgi:ribosomal protein S18 acetylase RimI-like enzyme